MSEFVNCPYNSNHRVLQSRLSYHIIKCEKKYQRLKLEMCPFNATHRIREIEMGKHLETCEDYQLTKRIEYETM